MNTESIDTNSNEFQQAVQEAELLVQSIKEADGSLAPAHKALESAILEFEDSGYSVDALLPANGEAGLGFALTQARTGEGFWEVYSRYILAWKVSSTMNTEDVKETLEIALDHSGLSKARVRHQPRLLSDNGPAYLSNALAKYIKAKDMEHVRGAPYHPMTQGKIERWHRTMKNVVKLENYYSPEELKAAIARFVNYYNQERYHESLENMTPAEVYYGRAEG